MPGSPSPISRPKTLLTQSRIPGTERKLAVSCRRSSAEPVGGPSMNRRDVGPAEPVDRLLGVARRRTAGRARRRRSASRPAGAVGDRRSAMRTASSAWMGSVSWNSSMRRQPVLLAERPGDVRAAAQQVPRQHQQVVELEAPLGPARASAASRVSPVAAARTRRARSAPPARGPPVRAASRPRRASPDLVDRARPVGPSARGSKTACGLPTSTGAASRSSAAPRRGRPASRRAGRGAASSLSSSAVQWSARARPASAEGAEHLGPRRPPAAARAPPGARQQVPVLVELRGHLVELVRRSPRSTEPEHRGPASGSLEQPVDEGRPTAHRRPPRERTSSSTSKAAGGRPRTGARPGSGGRSRAGC